MVYMRPHGLYAPAPSVIPETKRLEIFPQSPVCPANKTVFTNKLDQKSGIVPI